MDREADSLGLPKVEEYSEERRPKLVGGAAMDKVAAARLQEDEALFTTSLASCTGVTLYDPQTKVAAIIHVYQKASIQDALTAMQKIDPNVDPSRLQVTLMPGALKGVNMSHLEKLRHELGEAGITHVRDFSKEGRTSGELMIKGDGVVIAQMKPLQWETQVEQKPKKTSVGESLGLGKYAPTHQGESQGADISSPGKLKRSQSAPDLRGGVKHL